MTEYGHPVLTLLAPQAGEKILDLGCGDGTLTLKVAESGAHVLAIDTSKSMVQAAIERGLNAKVKSGEALDFEADFDAVFSNAALHWMLDYQSTIRGIYDALLPNGRFVGEFGGQGNIEYLVEGMRQVFTQHPEFGEFVNPWFFPSPEHYQTELERVGFDVEYIELIARPTPLSSGIREWLSIFADGIIAHLTSTQKSQFMKEVEALVSPRLLKGQSWEADYVRLRFVARKSAPS